MTTSNQSGLSLRNKERSVKEYANKFKAILFLSIILCFTLTINAQNTNTYQELDKYKSSWMQDHNLNDLNPEQYEQMKSEWELSKKIVRPYKLEQNEPVDPIRQKKYENWKGKNIPSGFPTYDLTGDKAVDDANYDAKKQLWIEKYPNLYHQMINSENKEMTEAEKNERERVLNQK